MYPVGKKPWALKTPGSKGKTEEEEMETKKKKKSNPTQKCKIGNRILEKRTGRGKSIRKNEFGQEINSSSSLYFV